jgi:hypothetical protein
MCISDNQVHKKRSTRTGRTARTVWVCVFVCIGFAAGPGVQNLRALGQYESLEKRQEREAREAEEERRRLAEQKEPVRPEGQVLEFREISRGAYSAIEEEKFQVLHTEQDLADLWARMHRNRSAEPPLPDLDLNEETGIALFMGTRPTGGYAVSVEAVARQKDTVVVYYRRTEPRPQSIVTQALTSPYVFIAIPEKPDWVEFKDADADR